MPVPGSGSADSTVRIWDLAAQRHHQILDQSDGWWVLDFAFSPDSRFVAVVNNDSVIQVHDIDSGALVSAAAPFGSVGLRWSRMERHIATSGFETIIWAAPGDQLTRHRGTVPGISRVGS